MNQPFTIKDILTRPCAHLNPHLEQPEPKKKRSKYNNVRVEFDGKWFDSQKECNRYVTLRVLLNEGLIKWLECQVEFELNEGGSHSLKYVADFMYVDCETNEFIVEDVKGFRTNVYKKKRALMEKVHGIIIKEI